MISASGRTTGTLPVTPAPGGAVASNCATIVPSPLVAWATLTSGRSRAITSSSLRAAS
jgi:hypothetical protein